MERIQSLREENNLPPLTRTESLDAVATARAIDLAQRDHSMRMRGRGALSAAVREAGVAAARSYEFFGMRRGRDLVPGFSQSIRSHGTTRKNLLDPEFARAGLAAVAAEDGWTMLILVLVQDRPAPPEPKKLEQQAFKAVNKAREAHGVGKLRWWKPLNGTSRKHSEEMARLGYVGHDSPSGTDPGDRLRYDGVSCRAYAENIQSSYGYLDPVQRAVDDWLASPGHRENMLDPRFTHSAMGVAVTEKGQILFTQMFCVPM